MQRLNFGKYSASTQNGSQFSCYDAILKTKRTRLQYDCSDGSIVLPHPSIAKTMARKVHPPVSNGHQVVEEVTLTAAFAWRFIFVHVGESAHDIARKTKPISELYRKHICRLRKACSR